MNCQRSLLAWCIALIGMGPGAIVYAGTPAAVAPPAPSADSTRWSDVVTGALGNFAADAVSEAEFPATLDSTEIPWVVFGAAGTAAVFALDATIDAGVRDWKSRSTVVASVSPYLSEFGGTYGIGGALLFVGYSCMFGDAYDRHTSALLAESLAMTTLWSRMAKFLTGRQRPSVVHASGAHGSGTWYGPIPAIAGRGPHGVANYDAFPSGHTTTAFAIATVMAERYSGTWWVPPVAYGAAGLVGISRIIEETHWASDVAVGALLGYFTAHSIVAAHDDKPSSEEGGPEISVVPSMVRDAPGVALCVVF